MVPSRDRTADRYSLLRKLSIAEPDPQSLELSFTASDRNGVKQVEKGGKSKNRRLQRLFISPCAATEVKASIMRMLTRMHLEREFKKKTEPPPAGPSSPLSGSEHDEA